MDVSYSVQGAGLLAGLVALQQVWGVDFNTAVQRADRAIAAYLQTHGQTPQDLAVVAGFLASLAPQSG